MRGTSADIKEGDLMLGVASGWVDEDGADLAVPVMMDGGAEMG